jgi:hypothetical protein
MAIINSLAVGAARKSAGNITYVMQKGRTVLKSKIVSGMTRSSTNPSDAQILQRSRMAVIGHFASLINANIQTNLTESQYGYKYNTFIKQNYAYLVQAFESVITPLVLQAKSGIDIRNDARSLSFSTLNALVIAFITTHPDTLVLNNLSASPIYVPVTGYPTPPVPFDLSGFTIEGESVTLPASLSPSSEYSFFGTSLSPERIRVLVGSTTYLLNSPWFTLLSQSSTLIKVEDKLNPTASNYNLNEIEILTDKGKWIKFQ